MHSITRALLAALMGACVSCATIQAPPGGTTATPEERAQRDADKRSDAGVPTDTESAPEDVGFRMGNVNLRDAAGTIRTFRSIDVGSTHTPVHAIGDDDGTQTLDLVGSNTATAGTERSPLSFGVRRDADTTIADADGKAAPLQLDATGALKVTGGGGGTQVVTDAASSGTDTGTLSQTVRQDTIAESTSLTGDFQPLKSDQFGSTYVRPTFEDEGGVQVVSNAAPLPVDVGTVAVTNADMATVASAIHAEDSAHSTGQFSIPALARADAYDGFTDSTSTTPDDYVLLNVDPTTGNLRVGDHYTLLSSQVDDAALTLGTNRATITGGFFDDVTPDSVNEGDVGALRMSGNRVLYTQLRDAAGNERGVNVTASNELKVDDDSTQTSLATLNTTTGLTQKLISSAYADGYGSYGVYVKQATPSALSGVADGENSPAAVDMSQRMYVANSGDTATIFTTLDTTTNTNSSTIDVRQCSEVWIEFEWVTGAATATGSLTFYGSLTTPITEVTTDTVILLGADGSSDASFMNATQCSVPAAPNNDQADYSVSAGSMPEWCAMRIPNPPPYILVRHDAGTGGSAGDLSARLFCRQF